MNDIEKYHDGLNSVSEKYKEIPPDRAKVLIIHSASALKTFF